MRLLALLSALALGAPLAPATAADTLTLRNGVASACARSEQPLVDGETHHCVYAPSRSRNREFTTANSRTLHAVSELGPRCRDIELLDQRRLDGDEERWRLAVACLR